MAAAAANRCSRVLISLICINHFSLGLR
jgi:hypothetical protein